MNRKILILRIFLRKTAILRIRLILRIRIFVNTGPEPQTGANEFPLTQNIGHNVNDHSVYDLVGNVIIFIHGNTLSTSGPVFTKILILRIFLRIVIFLRKILRIRIFLFTKQFLAKNNSKNRSKNNCVHRLD